MPTQLTTDQLNELVTHFNGDTNAAISFVITLRRKDRTAATQFIENQLSSASADLKAGLIAIVPEFKTQIPMSRGKQFAVLWVCGATYGQIAAIYGVSTGTAAHMVKQHITQLERAELLPNRSKYTINEPHTVIAAYREILHGLTSDSSNYALLTQGSVSRIALAVIQEYKSQQSMYQEDGPSAYDTLDDAPSRLPSME